MKEKIIKDSHQRSLLEWNLDPDTLPVSRKVLSEQELLLQRTKYHEIITVLELFSNKVIDFLQQTPVLIVLTDEQGHILKSFGDPAIKITMEQLGISDGVGFTEEDMGTNVVYLSLRHNIPLELVGKDHYHSVLSNAACYSAPFCFKEINQLSGSISMMTYAQYHSFFSLSLLVNMVDSMERELLLRRNQRNQTLLNHLMITKVNNGVIITDPYGNITEFNAFAEQITNQKKEEVLGKSIFPFNLIGNYLYEVIINNRKFDNVELTFSNGSMKRICLLDATPIVDDEGSLLGAYAQFRDITERCELERQVIAYEKFTAVGKLAAGLAHEIRNPLTSIMGFIHLMRNKVTDHHDHRFYLDIVYSELEHMNKMVTDFVAMAKPSMPERRPCSIEKLIKDTVSFMESQVIIKNSVIETDLPDGNTIMMIDCTQIKQVLVNLIQNAIDATVDGGSIHISSTYLAESREVEIMVRDNGIGMGEETLKEILNPFFTTKENGLGLGLSICYRIIENHKGRININSQPSIGTTFTVVLPTSL